MTGFSKKTASRVTGVSSCSLSILDTTFGGIRVTALLRLVPLRASSCSSRLVEAFRLRAGLWEVGRVFKGGDGDLDSSEYVPRRHSSSLGSLSSSCF